MLVELCLHHADFNPGQRTFWFVVMLSGVRRMSRHRAGSIDSNARASHGSRASHSQPSMVWSRLTITSLLVLLGHDRGFSDLLPAYTRIVLYCQTTSTVSCTVACMTCHHQGSCQR